MNTENKMFGLIKNRIHKMSCMRPFFMPNRPLRSGGFQPLNLVFLKNSASAIEATNNYFYSSVLIKPRVINFVQNILGSTRRPVTEPGSYSTGNIATNTVAYYADVRRRDLFVNNARYRGGNEVFNHLRHFSGSAISNTLRYFYQRLNSYGLWEDNHFVTDYKRERLSLLFNKPIITAFKNINSKILDSMIFHKKKQWLDEKFILRTFGLLNYMGKQTKKTNHEIFKLTKTKKRVLSTERKEVQRYHYSNEEELYYPYAKTQFESQDQKSNQDTPQQARRHHQENNSFKHSNTIRPRPVKAMSPSQTKTINTNNIHIDIDRLTDSVIQKINKKIRIEHERRGLL